MRSRGTDPQSILRTNAKGPGISQAGRPQTAAKSFASQREHRESTQWVAPAAAKRSPASQDGGERSGSLLHVVWFGAWVTVNVAFVLAQPEPPRAGRRTRAVLTTRMEELAEPATPTTSSEIAAQQLQLTILCSRRLRSRGRNSRAARGVKSSMTTSWG